MARHRSNSATYPGGTRPFVPPVSSSRRANSTRSSRKAGSHGRFPCSIPGCFAVANHLSSMCRHKWGHLPQHLLPTCRGHLPNGNPCPVRYQGRADTMKRHWLTHHANEGPYVQDRYPPFEDLWRLVGEGEVVLSPPTGARRSPGFGSNPAIASTGAPAISLQDSSNQIRRVSTQSSPISNQDSGPDSESEEEMHPEPAFSPYVSELTEERHFYDYSSIQRVPSSAYVLSYGSNPSEIPEFGKTGDADSLSSGPGPGYTPASVSPFELSLMSHPPAGHPLPLYNRLPATRCP